MTKPNPFLWPKGSMIVIKDRFGELRRSTSRWLDLADAIMLGTDTRQKTVTLSFLMKAAEKHDQAERLESLIIHDLCFDGYAPKLWRQQPTDPLIAYQWKIRIKPA